MRRAALFASAALLAMLAACTAPDRIAPVTEPALPVAAAANSRSSADELMTYLARLRTMNETSLAAEAARQKRDSADLGRVKAAMALSLSTQAEESDILALLDPLLKRDNGDRDVKAMASFLHTMVMERRRLKESAAAAGAKLRDERRTAETQKQRAETLQQKLDALTELEKSLSDRNVQSR
jgi:hypothetical protein